MIARSTAIEPKIAKPPTANGSDAATNAAEHPHQHQKAQRDRDGFHELEIFLGLEVDLGGGDRITACAHRHAVTVVYQFVAESFGMLLRAALDRR